MVVTNSNKACICIHTHTEYGLWRYTLPKGCKKLAIEGHHGHMSAWRDEPVPLPRWLDSHLPLRDGHTRHHCPLGRPQRREGKSLFGTLQAEAGKMLCGWAWCCIPFPLWHSPLFFSQFVDMKLFILYFIYSKAGHAAYSHVLKLFLMLNAVSLCAYSILMLMQIWLHIFDTRNSWFCYVPFSHVHVGIE